MYLKVNQTAIFKSKKGKIYELKNINGKLVCYSMPEHVKRKATKEILKTVETEKSEKEYIVYTDGGCEFNPGGCGGIGVVIIDKSTGELKEISKGYYATTNNRMEIMAIIEALKQVPANSKVYLYSDSQYALNCINGVWQKRKNIDLWEEFAFVSKDKKIKTNWVRGHNGNPNNERCDELATQGIKNANNEDNGYISEENTVRNQNSSGGAMAIKIDVPSECNYEPLTLEEYIKKYKVKKSCALAINKFSKSSKKFKDYLNLKTGGIDFWSKKKKSDFIEMYGIETIEKIEGYFKSDKDLESCFRWHARGLSLKDSIRKTFVDIEVRKNAQGNF